MKSLTQSCPRRGLQFALRQQRLDAYSIIRPPASANSLSPEIAGKWFFAVKSAICCRYVKVSGSSTVIKASTRFRIAASSALSISPGPFTSRD